MLNSDSKYPGRHESIQHHPVGIAVVRPSHSSDCALCEGTCSSWFFHNLRSTSFSEIRSNLCPAITASSTHELVFKITERNIVRPLIGVDACPMQTTNIGAVHDQAVNTGRSPFTQCHLLAVHRYSPFGGTSIRTRSRTSRDKLFRSRRFDAAFFSDRMPN